MRKAIKTFICISFAVYSLALIYLLFANRAYYFSGVTLTEYFLSCSNFVPFKTILYYITAMSTGSINSNIPVENLLGNLFMFLPMGIFLPCFFKKLRRLGPFLLGMLIILIIVEGTQLVLRAGSFDVDDLILNIAGAAAGFGLWKLKPVQKAFNYIFMQKSKDSSVIDAEESTNL